jgi:hypothetical protein
VRAAYTGHEALTFSDYLDAATGKTLRAEPGRVYDIIPASGRPVDDIPRAWFRPVPPPPPFPPAPFPPVPPVVTVPPPSDGTPVQL